MIEIHGAGFRNKGAQMMLRTVLDRLSGEEFCIESGSDRTVEDRKAYGLHSLFPRVPESRRKIPAAFRRSCIIGRLTPRPICARHGWVRRHDTDALIDISGYAYGDAWSRQSMRAFGIRAAQYRRRGKPVVLLPQMLGPFRKSESADEFRRIYENCDLIYARDPISLQQARACAGEDARLRLAPDITIFAEPPASPAMGHPYACIVPNRQLLRKSPDREIWREVYIRRLVGAGRRIARGGLHVAILVHDMVREDLAMAEQINAELGSEYSSLYMEPDPMRIKAFIAGSRFIVSSRFHSLVAALSSGVPAAVIGWGHKYDTLLVDFGMADMMHRAEDTDGQLSGLIERLMDAGESAQWRKRLLAAKEAMRPANDGMWKEVCQALSIRG